ncbi:MAG: hypothetical protein LBS54_04135 [Dysgonamonadaceae bacterium]|jgi:hypothetical protein|nr:hypothetical protein [Dysgonamonadaceae bacterium]
MAKETEKEVKGQEPVTVEWGEGAKYHKKGTKSVLHEIQAKKFVAAGIAKIIKD